MFQNLRNLFSDESGVKRAALVGIICTVMVIRQLRENRGKWKDVSANMKVAFVVFILGAIIGFAAAISWSMDPN